MAKNYVIRGLPARPVVDILPPGFDPEMVSAFFARGKKPAVEKRPEVTLDSLAGQLIRTNVTSDTRDGAPKDIGYTAVYGDEFVFA